MIGRYPRTACCFAVVATCMATLGCSSTRVPDDARLIWSGEVTEDGQVWKNVYPDATGQIYVVDQKTGRVEGVQTVWPEQPNFRFSLRPHRRHDLYFAQQRGAASRPAG